MKHILYLCTAPEPAIPGTDAVFQEIERLRASFGGSFLGLYPFKKPSRFVPHWLMGIHNRERLREAMRQADVVHVFSATLKPLPCIEPFSGRIVYTVTAAAGRTINATWFNDRMITVAASHEREADRLRRAGVKDVTCVVPGLELGRFACTPAPAKPFTLLVGSAPWTRAQFRTKGVDVLIEAMRRIPELNITFLWRNLWHDDLRKRIDRAGLAARTVVHNQRMDVSHVLSGCHAAVVLAAHERLVKAWPHSAIESLASGRPVLLSRAIPMSDFAEQNQAGVAVESLEIKTVEASIRRLIAEYDTLSGTRLRDLALRHFDPVRMADTYRSLYVGD